MKKIKNLIMVAALMAASLVPVVSVSAVSTKISIAPMHSRVILTPGETYTGVLNVMNPVTAEGDLNYEVAVGSYTLTSGDGKDSYGGVDVTTITNMNAMVDWITLENATGTLVPNETTTVIYHIAVPETAPAGGQYASLLVREAKGADADSDNMSGVNEVVQMASVIYATVNGETITEGEILANEVPAFLLENKLETNAMVENKGNVHTDAEFKLQVWAMGSDEEICATSSEQSTEIVLPDTKKYHQESCELPGIGMYKVKQTVRIFDEESVVERMVLYCPIWLMLIVLFVVALIVIWIATMIMKRKK